ncbi:hypothetical protein ACL9RL_07110 [Plantibacter sp. Mn2098]|uniref:hypothetical protein n=1 Tax=Plantibacter sp. Mn2098 TaxID=3395266 RepID=UPI003BE0B880
MNTINATGTWKHEQGSQTSSVDKLIRRAVESAAENGLEFSPSKCSRVVRAHIRRGGTIATAAELLSYCMSHADPTGEIAAFNVDAFDRMGLDAGAIRSTNLSRGDIVALKRGTR